MRFFLAREMKKESGDLGVRVIDALSANPQRPPKARELARNLRIPARQYRGFRSLLRRLEKQGRIERVKGHRYQLRRTRKSELAGLLTITRRGDGFVRLDQKGGDVFIPASRLGTGMEGDRVHVEINQRRRGKNRAGTVLEVLSRARKSVVGRIYRVKRQVYLAPLGKGPLGDVLIQMAPDMEVDEGDVAIVNLRSYGDARLPPTGRVERVLGRLSDPGVDVLAIACESELPIEFPPDVLSAAEQAISARVSDPGIRRIDRSSLLCFTIDPSDAQDHDDALSIVELEGGSVEVGVHIADVAHFVRPEDPMDAEARERGTSVYLVDRVIPMLPPVLSTEVCSLNPEVRRFAISLFLELDQNGSIKNRRYERTVIECRYALSYGEAQAVLDKRSSISQDVDRALFLLDQHAKFIRSERRARGGLDLDLPEAKVVLDENGFPIGIQRRERYESHRLVEDFMIFANEVVANDLCAHGARALFRVHEPPTAESVEELAEAMSALGVQRLRGKSLDASNVQALIDSANGIEQKALVSSLVLRTLQRARYDKDNIGHFGLGSDAYVHFTSPIRRYPDLVVQRAVAAAFLGDEGFGDLGSEALEVTAELASAREQRAVEAERETVALKKVEFMEARLGETFPARITGVTSFGLFVTLDEYFVDGLVHVRSMEDDFYQVSEGKWSLVGERTGNRHTLGDHLEVQVIRVDKEARHIDFSYV